MTKVLSSISILFVSSLLIAPAVAHDHTAAQPIKNTKRAQEDKFRQLDEVLPTPNAFHTASGAPGPEYWQQQANYVIDVQLDDVNHRIKGSETVTYSNNSSHELPYLWLQLDANYFANDSDAVLSSAAPDLDGELSFQAFRRVLARQAFNGGMTVQSVRALDGSPLPHSIVGTMMRVDLPAPLEPGEQFRFSVSWEYAINNSAEVGGRTGYEQFEDGSCLYEIAQWFPRMAAYTHTRGWQHKQFLGRGEFTLEFGDYTVRITVPETHVVAATGVLLNGTEVMTPQQRDRLEKASTADKPMFVITPAEAKANESRKPTGTKTWVFRAEQVRDFAFASSPKFIWDAQGCDIQGNQVMAMSFYPNEGEPLWSKYSTHAIIHTLNVYSRLTFPFPYPTAISVNGPVGGMEYPMICFNGPRPEKDGTYSARTKYGLISVVIHEVGHNFFPMIVNTDERQWTWMDEGMNTFLQHVAEQEWEEDYLQHRGGDRDIRPYMQGTGQVPIMTNSESILQFHNNAYIKPAKAFMVLRETILGRDLFDFAFREYARRWQFKRPEPADFFRTMEDASGIDLDWFWRGWFYSTDHCDIAIKNVQVYRVDPGDPAARKARQRETRDRELDTLTRKRNEDLAKRVDTYPELRDFYNDFDPLDATEEDRKKYEGWLAKLDDREKQLLKTKKLLYIVDLENVGGLVMPVILQIDFEGGKQELLRIPAEIWCRDCLHARKLILAEEPIKQITLDPQRETMDVNEENNRFPPGIEEQHFELTKPGRSPNPMQKAAGAKK